MSKIGKVFLHDEFAGKIIEDENGFSFYYDSDYLNNENAKPISLTMPLTEKTYKSNTMLPFFDGLIPEGWLLDIVNENWKIDSKDRMSLLLQVCRDCIGAVSIVPHEESK
ncbi:MAG: HipA N-terminal domain-containing protein [Ignavibacteriales bacterium]|nr:HipA N-terminal domain-containing protein [Ignavibacteriales bacterium]